MEDNKESIEFWEEKRKEIGKEILFKSFAKFLGETNKGPNGLSGLLFATEDRVYFEDFEKSTMFDFLMRKKRKYEKFTMNFLVDDTDLMRKVSEASAVACINGDLEEARPQGGLMSIFSSPVWEIKFKSNESYFFELFEPEVLVKILNK